MWRYRWPGVLVAWIVAIGGVIAVFQIPEQYEASARIHVDTQSILKPLMAGLAVQPDVAQQVVMLSRTLISRPNVEKLMRMAELGPNSRSKAQQEDAIDALMKTLKITSAGRDNLYILSFRDADPEKAKRAVQSLVSIFVESGLGASRKDSDSAKVFISEQIKTYQAKLEEAEARLKEFRLRHLDVQFGEGKDTATRLADMTNLLEKARLELREAEKSRDAAKAALANENSQTTSLSTQSLLQESALSASTPAIDARLDVQRRNLDTLLQRYTEQHPEVTAARRLVSELEAQKQKEIQELRRAVTAAPSAPAGAGASLASQELNRVLAISEIQVAALRARVSEYAARQSQLRAALRTAPQIEAEAAQLNRDYTIHKKNYESLVARRESAAISGDMDIASGVADFRLIDPPRVSPKPVAPNHMLMLPLVLIAALGAGLFAAFAASHLRPVFHQVSDLRAKFDVPIVGAVSLILSDDDVRRQRAGLLGFCAASGSLVCLFGIGLAAMSMLANR